MNRKKIKWTVLQDYLNEAKDLLGLNLWLIEIDKTEPEVNARAAIYTPYYTYSAKIYFSNDFFSGSQELMKRDIAHELIHLHQARVLAFIDVSTHVDESAFKLVNEPFVDCMAALMWPVLPTIPKLVED